MKLLHIDSSITGEKSVSRTLSAAIVAKFQAGDAGLELVRRDLAASPLPLFNAETLAGIGALPEPQPAGHAAEERLDRQVLREFMGADVIVVGAPMYNFGVPAQLKTWIDYLCVAGVTFQYSATGPVGLVHGKRVFIASSRGGIYSPGAPAAAVDHQETYLQAVFGFFGITDVTVVRAEGLAMGPEPAAKAIAQANDQIGLLAA